MWFLESFGLKIEKMVLISTTSDERVELNFSPSDVGTSSTRGSMIEDPAENTMLMEVLFLLEKFDVSDEFYHELSMKLPLPKSYKVKHLRSDISCSVEMRRFPEPAIGTYRPVTEFLQALISDQVCTLYIAMCYITCHHSVSLGRESHPLYE